MLNGPEDVISPVLQQVQAAQKKPCEVLHAARSTVRGFTNSVLKTKTDKNPAPVVIMLYVHVRERTGERRWNSRALVATHTRLYLCAEDLSRWPLSPTQPVLSPQFISARDIDIADLSGIEVLSDVNVKINADVGSGKQKNISITVEFGHPEDCSWAIGTLQRLFFGIMKVAIDIKK